MIVCPRCSHENEDSAMNCANCRINLQWALENPHEAVPATLEGVKGPLQEAHVGDRGARVGTSSARGFLVIGLLLAILASGFLAFWFYLNACFSSGSAQSGFLAGALLWLVVAVICIPAGIVVLLCRQPKPNIGGALRLWVLIALVLGLGYYLLRLVPVILPEYMGKSLTIQYTLGRRDFSELSLGRVDLTEAKLARSNLSGANLLEAGLSGADLRDADLSGAFLRQVDLSSASLEEATLRRANLSRANLRGADLGRANLRDANLSGADLSRANLHYANLSAADLRGADLTGAKVTAEQLAQAGNLKGAILPDGSVHE